MQNKASTRITKLIDLATNSELSRPNIRLCKSVIYVINKYPSMAKEAATLLKNKLTSLSPKTVFLGLMITDLAM